MSDNIQLQPDPVVDAEQLHNTIELGRRQIAELPPFDAARWRVENGDNSPEARQQRRAATVAMLESNLAAFTAKHGHPEPKPATPQEIALADVDHRLDGALQNHQAERIDDEVEREEGLTEAERRQRAAALKTEFGETEYARLIADARFAIGDDNSQWRPAIESNKFALQMLAGLGRYYRQVGAERTRILRVF